MSRERKISVASNPYIHYFPSAVKPPRHILLAALIGWALLSTSCGYDPNQPVYDYTLNPDGFPPAALRVLRGVEADSIDGYQGIISAFGTLYSEQPALLDNPDWQAVIQKLGAKFRYKADNLVLLGPGKYADAGDLYTLAAFARPNDVRSVEQRDLFELWNRAIADSLVHLSDWTSEKSPSMAKRLFLARAFVLDDSLSAVFAKRYLIPRLFVPAVDQNLLNLQPHASLTDADRALANLLGLNVRPPQGRLAAFERPSIEFVAAEFVPAGKGMIRAAFYFIPRQKIDSNLVVALRLRGTDPTASGSGEINLDFLPATPTAKWKIGRVAVAYRKFGFSESTQEAMVGLYDNAAAAPRFVELEGSGRRLLPLTVEPLADAR